MSTLAIRIPLFFLVFLKFSFPFSDCFLIFLVSFGGMDGLFGFHYKKSEKTDLPILVPI